MGAITKFIVFVFIVLFFTGWVINIQYFLKISQSTGLPLISIKTNLKYYEDAPTTTTTTTTAPPTPTPINNLQNSLNDSVQDTTTQPAVTKPVFKPTHYSCNFNVDDAGSEFGQYYYWLPDENVFGFIRFSLIAYLIVVAVLFILISIGVYTSSDFTTSLLSKGSDNYAKLLIYIPLLCMTIVACAGFWMFFTSAISYKSVRKKIRITKSLTTSKECTTLLTYDKRDNTSRFVFIGSKSAITFQAFMTFLLGFLSIIIGILQLTQIIIWLAN